MGEPIQPADVRDVDRLKQMLIERDDAWAKECARRDAHEEKLERRIEKLGHELETLRRRIGVLESRQATTLR